MFKNNWSGVIPRYFLKVLPGDSNMQPGLRATFLPGHLVLGLGYMFSPPGSSSQWKLNAHQPQIKINKIMASGTLEILPRGERSLPLLALQVESKELEEEGRSLLSLLCLPHFWIYYSECVVESRAWGRSWSILTWRPAQPSPGVNWRLTLFAMKHKNPSVSVFATHFKIGSGGQEMMMSFLFIYILTLLTGKFEMGRALKQLPENRQVTENRPQWRGKKIDSGCDILCGQLIPSDSLSRGGVSHQGTRDKVFVIGLLTGTLARGHLGTEQQINFPFCVHCSAELSQLPGTPDGCGHLE